MAEPTAEDASGLSFDVVVVGSGVGGLVAALTASLEGLRVVIVEKEPQIGGTSAMSGGTVWIPPREPTDPAPSAAGALAYLSSLIGPGAPHELIRQFLDSGQAALDDLAARAGIRFIVRDHSPDYHPERTGGSLGGRSRNPVPFDGRLLRRELFNHLRPPMSAFMLLGGMMVDLQDVQHLLGFWRSPRSFAHSLSLLMRYLADRLRGYHRGTRLVLGNALVARLLAALDARGVACQLDTRALELVIDGGRVTGVVVIHGGRKLQLRAASGVVLATGGNSRAKHQPLSSAPTSRSVAAPGSTGDGIGMALRAGVALGAAQNEPAYWVPVSVHRQPDGQDIRYPHFAWDRAKPGLIAVNAAGERFVDESCSYHAFVRAMRAAGDGQPAPRVFLVCDSLFMRKWGLGLAKPAGWPRGDLLRSGYLVRSGTLNGLARLIGVDPAGLRRTVERINALARDGRDSDFGKGSSAYGRHLGDPLHRPNPCLGPLDRPPFYAVQVHPGDIGTTVGVQTDIYARALRHDGQAVEGLHIVGNDMHAIMGGEYPGPGITLGPALTFGWLAGRHLAGRTR